MNLNLWGTGVAMVTPFNKDGAVDFPALKKLTNHLIDNDIDYLVVMGTTGESATLSKQEKEEIHATVKAENQGKLTYVAGLGGNNTAELVQEFKKFNYDGVDAILSVSPYYNKPSQAGIIQHYTALADASKKPIILYNVPGRTGSNMTAETTLKLAEHPNIAGMKEASANFEQIMEIMRNKPEGFNVVSGDDALTLPLLGIGLDGVISVIANAYPKRFSELVKEGLSGNFIASRLCHYELLPIMQAIFDDGNPGGIKEVLEYLGICEKTVRLPLANVNEQTKTKLLSLAKKIK
ncbi:MAG: 4-hydroxy-tetrahydrodipicolinate synthase [Bacteroidetes bacterium]|nr:MAG: 4-hydroxy-tetrahydrodipicolinate synthase [Bacteroidota bacterium]